VREPIEWRHVGALDDIPQLGARRLSFALHGKPLAVFRTASDEVYALVDECPHRGGPLSEGLISGATVACPLHNWVINLADGCAVLPDEGACGAIPVKIENGEIYIGLAKTARLAGAFVGEEG